MEWEHKSKIPRKMHACGQDARVTMLLGAAKIFRVHQEEKQVICACFCYSSVSVLTYGP